MSYCRQLDCSSVSSEVIEIPITDCLDLHTFRPQEIHTLIPEYLQQCLQMGILKVRLIHGKGKGIQRAQVRQILDRLEMVSGYQDAPPELGHYGATIVWLNSSAQ